LNGYSANPEQLRHWLTAAVQAFKMCGVTGVRHAFSAAEVATLRDLQRGAFARTRISKGQKITEKQVFFAIPNVPGQVVANDFSKYTDFFATSDVEPEAPVLSENTRRVENRALVTKAIGQVKSLLSASRVVVPSQIELEISHHYGLENFERFGSTVITVVNREYCKRVIVLVPGQTHPEQYHKNKDETYHILHGEISLSLDGVRRQCGVNEVIIIPRGVRHGFTTQTGVVIEEISTCYDRNDSYYIDKEIEKNTQRKTHVTYWLD
jgi:mannose-6-phosphate isomerase-like protein (cupin superfamily)